MGQPMFEKTFSFWHRWVGESTVPSPAETTQDERRLWARYPADVQGNVQLTETDAKIQANVRDLSVGGANLIVNRRLEAGQMLSLELPGAADEVRTILACVVRVHAQADGGWSLGCVFARELTEDDLHTFGAQKTVADDHDQRSWVRFHCKLNASYRKGGDPATSSDTQPQPAEIPDISANGIGLSVQRTLEAGTLLNVDLLDQSGRLVRTLLAC